MDLRGKTLFIQSLAFIIIIAILLVFSSTIFIESYRSLEANHVKDTLHLVDASVNNQITNLNSIVHDWGPWDDLYSYAGGNKSDFAAINLGAETFHNLDLNFVVITDNKGNILYARGFDTGTNEFTEPPAGLLTELTDNTSPLHETDKENPVSGFLNIPEGPVILSTYPILHSDITGPVAGTVIMGRNLDKGQVDKLALVTVPTLEITPYNESFFSPDENRILQSDHGSPELIRPLDDQTIEGSLLLKDIYGRDSLILKLQQPRDIYQQGKNTLLSFLIILILVAVFAGIMSILIIDRFVLSRLTRLSREVDAIGARGSLSSRVQVEGNDEITRFAMAMNETLSKLENAQLTLQASEERYRSVVETSPTGIIVTDPGGTVTFCNQRTARFLGVNSYEEVRGRKIFDLVEPGEKERAGEILKEVLEKGSGSNIEFFTVRLNGTPVNLEINASVIRDTGGKAEGIIFITQDVTKRTRAEASLRESESYYRAIFKNTGTATIIVSEDRIIRHVNAEFERLSGYLKEEIENKKKWSEFVHKDDLDMMEHYHDLRRKDKGLAPKRYEFRLIDRRGSIHFCFVMVDIIPGTSMSVASMLDITERVQMEQALQDSENYLKSLLSGIQAGIFVIDATTHEIIDANPAALEMIGIESKSEIINRKCHSFVCPAIEGNCPVTDLWQRVDNAECELIRADGRVINIIKHVVPVTLWGKQCLLETFIDNTERKQMQWSLEASEEKYRNILERVQDGYYRTDVAGNMILASPSVAKALGYDALEDIYGKSIANFLYVNPEKRKDFLEKIMESGEVANYEVEIKKRDGDSLIVSTSSHLYFDSDGKYQGIEGLCRDITEIRKTEAALRESEKRYRDFIELLPQSVFEIDMAGKVVSLNNIALLTFGYNKADARAVNVFDLIVPKDRDRAFINMQRILAGEYIGGVEYNVIRKDCSIFPAIVYATPMYQNNIVTGSRGILIDITERKKAEEALRESEEKYRFISENSNDLTYTLDLEGHFTHISGQIRQYGFEPGDFLGHHFTEFVEEEDLEKVIRDANETINTGEKSLTVFRSKDKKGIIHWIEDNSNPIRDKSGLIIGIVGVMREISERKKAEEAIQEREQFLKRLIEAISNPIFYKDTNGHFTGCNSAFEKFIGFSKDQIIGKTVFDIAPRDLAETYSAREKELIENQGIQNYETKVQHADGTLHDVIFSKVSMSDMKGNIEGIVGFIVDITEHKQMEDSIRLANKKLNLLNNITRHDILNTITGLFGLEAIASDMAGETELGEIIDEIRNHTKRMQQQITFTRDYQDIGVRSPTWQNLVNTISRAINIINFGKTGLIINAEDYEVYADPLLERVFYNLVENSLKYGGKLTKITFSTYISFNGLVITCDDDGTGIEEKDKELIFEHGFGRNTGLGLFLSREILGITGISIRETGVFGQGARFEILVPAGKYRVVSGHDRQ